MTSIVAPAGGGSDGHEGCARALPSGSTASRTAADTQGETAKLLAASSVGFAGGKAALQAPTLGEGNESACGEFHSLGFELRTGLLFVDGFESGTTAQWSAALP